MLVQRLDASGALAGAPIAVRTQAQVDADPRYVPSDLARLQPGIGVYAHPDGGFMATYRETTRPGFPGVSPTTTFAQRFDALGNRVGGPVSVGDDTTTAASTPSGGLITGGLFICGCNGSGSPTFEVFDASLQRLGSDTVNLDGDLASTPNGAGLANGRFVAVWTSSGQVHGVLLELAPGGGLTDVTPTAPLTRFLTFAGVGAGARVTALAGGGFLLSWGTSAQAFDANGFPVSEVVQILDGSIAPTPEGGFVVVAQVGGQLVAQEYAAVP